MRYFLISFVAVWGFSQLGFSQINASNILDSANHFNTTMKEALISDDLRILYNWLKSRGEKLKPFPVFKEERISLNHNSDNKNQYQPDVKDIIFYKPSPVYVKDGVVQVFIRRDTYTIYDQEPNNTIMWFYSKDGKKLKWGNFSTEIPDEQLLKQYPFMEQLGLSYDKL